MDRDPAFLFYDGDAARDVSHMNRLERGCYFDLIQAQKKFGGYTVEQARKILGKDFDTCWEALTLILGQENGIFYIPWVKESFNNRKEYKELQRKRIQKYWDKKNKIPRNNHGKSVDIPLENENENENVIKDVINKDRIVKERIFRRPTLEQVVAYCKEIGTKVDPETFFHNYESTGWVKANGQRVLNWKSTIRTWEKRDQKPVDMLTETQKRNIAKFKDFEKRRGLEDGI